MQAHTSSCASIISRAQYDTTCARCAQINRIIMLRRKRISNGCSMSEQLAAEAIAQTLVTKYELAFAECIDRAYARQQKLATLPTPMARAKRYKDVEIINDCL